MKRLSVLICFIFYCLCCFSIGNVLLKNDEEPKWGQHDNNNEEKNYTTPTYNMYCPQKRLVGCGAVAAGQVMWKYEWPLLSSYGVVDWDNKI